MIPAYFDTWKNMAGDLAKAPTHSQRFSTERRYRNHTNPTLLIVHSHFIDDDDDLPSLREELDFKKSQLQMGGLGKRPIKK